MNNPYEDEFYHLPRNMQANLQLIFKRSNDRKRYYAAAILRLLAAKEVLTTSQLQAELDEIPRTGFFRTIKTLWRLGWITKSLRRQGEVFYKLVRKKEDEKFLPVWIGVLTIIRDACRIVVLLKSKGEHTIEQIARKLEMQESYARFLLDDLVLFGWLELSEDKTTYSVLPKRPLSDLYEYA